MRTYWPQIALGSLAIAIAVIYADAINAVFLPWDDDYNLTKNPYIVVGGWWKLWLEPFYGMFVPVTDTVWAALYELGGGQTWPFRVTNAIFHFANTCLVYVLIMSWLKRARGSGSPAAALAGAALFALHPLQVGSVAWISDLRGIMSTFFGLLATLVFFRWRGLAGAAAAFALFVLGLLSKPQIAALPVVLLACVYVIDRNFLKGAALRLFPWLLASAAAAKITSSAQQAVVEWQTPFWMRPIVMADSYGFYIFKTLFPYPLAVDYGRTPSYLQDDLWRAMPTIAAFVCALGAIAWLASRDRRWSIALLWFVFLLPTSGLVDFGFQQISTVTDHYNYVPLIVLATVVATALASIFEPRRAWFLRAAIGSAAILLATGLGAASWERVRAWSGEREFFLDMVEKNPNSYSALIGLTNLMCTSSSQADIEKGLEFARRATMTRVEDPVSVADLGVCLIRLGRYPEALELESHFRNPDFIRRMKRHDFATASLFTSIGGVAFYLGQIDKGFAYVCEGARANAMSQQARDQIADMQRQLAARGDSRQCGPPLGIDGVVAMVNSIKMSAGPAPASSH
jgi:hypothetical protein